MEFSIYFEKKISVEKGTPTLGWVSSAQDLSIDGRMLYHLSYGGSTQLSSQNLYLRHIRLRIYHELINNFLKIISVDYALIIRRLYHSP